MAEDWKLTYIRHVLAQLDLKPANLAEMAGVRSTTLSRPLNSTAHQYKLSAATIEKVQAATGISFLPFAPDASPSEERRNALLRRLSQLREEELDRVESYLDGLAARGRPVGR